MNDLTATERATIANMLLAEAAGERSSAEDHRAKAQEARERADAAEGGCWESSWREDAAEERASSCAALARKVKAQR